MGYKDEFQKLIETERFEEARVLLEANKTFAYDDSFYYANMGWVLNHIGRYQEAVPYLQKGIHTFLEDAWMYSQLGYSFNHMDQHTEALPWLLKGIELGHDEVWVHGEVGWAYRQLEDYEHAIEYLENALLDEPDNIWIIAQAAFAYRDHGDRETAEIYLKKVCRLSPDDDSYFDLANFYKQEMRYEDELEALNHMCDETLLLTRDFEKAYALNRLQRHEEAMRLLEDSLQNGRDDTGLREELADAFMGLHEKERANEQYDIALKYYEKALERNKDDAYWILQDMVWIAQKQEDMIHKLQYLDRLSLIKTDDPWVFYHYAKTYANLNEFTKAVEYCDKNISSEGENTENLSLKAWLLGKQGKFEEAVAMLVALEENGRQDNWLYCELGWDYSELEQHDKAIACYEKAYALDNDDAWLISQIAWNKGSLKLYEEALAYFFKALEKGRTDGWIHANIGFNYLQLEKYEEALPYFNKAKETGYKENWFKKRFAELKKALKEKESKK